MKDRAKAVQAFFALSRRVQESHLHAMIACMGSDLERQACKALIEDAAQLVAQPVGEPSESEGTGPQTVRLGVAKGGASEVS